MSPYNPKPLLMLAIALTGVFAFIQVYSVQAILPVLIRDLGASKVQAGLAVGATVLGVALVSPFMGMLSDAVGRKVFIVGSLALLSLPTALMGSAATIEWLMLYRFLQGVLVPGVTVVLIAYIGEEFSGLAMTRLMSLYVTGSVLGGFLGRFLLGHLDELIGWRAACFVLTALCLFSALFVWKQLPPSRNFTAKPHFQAALSALKNHLSNHHVLAACGLGGCVLSSLVGCFTYINLHLALPPYALDSSQLANIFSVYLIGMVITPLSARLIGRFGSVHTMIGAVCLSALGLSATLLEPLALIIGALMFMSSGVFITQAATINYIAHHVKEGRSLASGLYYMAYYGGGTLGAWLCGIAYTRQGWPGVVGLLLAIQALALVIAVKGMKTA